MPSGPYKFPPDPDTLRLNLPRPPAPDLAVAHDILRYLGGKFFLRRMYARGLIGSHNSLSFRLRKRELGRAVGTIVITRQANGLHRIEFVGWARRAAMLIRSYADIPGDQLIAVIGLETGYTPARARLKPDPEDDAGLHLGASCEEYGGSDGA